MPGGTPSNEAWSGYSHGWRYLAERLAPGGGPGVRLNNELPLRDVHITDVLSGPPQLACSIDPVYRSLLGSDGAPILGDWSTIISAELNNEIQYSMIIDGMDPQGPVLNITGTGFCGYAQGQPYPGNDSFIEWEVLDVVRRAWQVLQADPYSNIGLQVDATTRTGVTLGAPTVVAPTPDPSSSNTTPPVTDPNQGPYALNWWSINDVGAEIDKLAASTPFDYHERHAWNSDKTQIQHFLDFGYPTLGRRLNGRFIQGENMQLPPTVSEAYRDFANQVYLLGAGTGSTMIRGSARRIDGRVLRTVQLSDTSITSKVHADSIARLELAKRNQVVQISSAAIRNTPSTPLHMISPGDEIRIQADMDWIDIDLWARITQKEIYPDQPDVMVVGLTRTDWLP